MTGHPLRSPIWITVDAAEPGRELEAFLRTAAPYGVILFARHLREASQVRELCGCIHETCAATGPLIALDQEGGRVSRLAALGHRYPGAADLAGDARRVEALAWEMGDVLRDLGFDVDFAPVADLGPAETGTGLEGRLYGDDPGTVTLCCGAFLAGLDKAGVRGCLKHFPGLGGSGVDSHKGLPRIPGSMAERTPHVEPYDRLARLAPYVMVAHGAYDYDPATPSTLCAETYRILAGTGFEGLSVTDDLAMGAVAGRAPLSGLASEALEAGASLALWVSTQDDTLRALEAIAEAPVFRARAADLASRLPEGDRA